MTPTVGLSPVRHPRTYEASMTVIAIVCFTYYESYGTCQDLIPRTNTFRRLCTLESSLYAAMYVSSGVSFSPCEEFSGLGASSAMFCGHVLESFLHDCLICILSWITSLLPVSSLLMSPLQPTSDILTNQINEYISYTTYSCFKCRHHKPAAAFPLPTVTRGKTRKEQPLAMIAQLHRCSRIKREEREEKKGPFPLSPSAILSLFWRGVLKRKRLHGDGDVGAGSRYPTD